ncbi:putative Late nodulin [Medicago truncatula]|nr:putative Late nodulin [Medicago truncatula]
MTFLLIKLLKRFCLLHSNDNNMAKIFMFVYVLIIFLSLFMVEANIPGARCATDEDCPVGEKCIGGNCVE